MHICEKNERKEKKNLARWRLPLKFARAFREDVIFPFDVDYAVFEDALPLVLHTLNLVISTEHHVPLPIVEIGVIVSKVVFVLGIIEIGADCCVVNFL